MEYKWEKDVLTESVMPMRKMMMVCSIFLLLVSCNRVDARAEIYVEAFENVLFEDGAYLDEISYISIFINEDDVPSYTLRFIQQTLIERYEKKVFTYKKEEIPETGPYGKENFREHGAFLYLTEVEERGETLFIRAEKYYTRKNHPSVEVEMIFQK